MVELFDGEVTVRRARYASEQTGFAVLDADSAGDVIVLVGPLIHLEERDRAHVRGRWVEDSRYGPQVKVTEAMPLPPADAEAVLSYLRRVRHVGPQRAARLLERHGVTEVLDVIDHDPATAFRAAGIRGDRATEAADAWNALRVTRQLHLRLAPHGLAYLVARVHEEYGATAHRVVADRPYELTSVFGVGFAIADRIARTGDGTPDAGERARAGLLHLLVEAERSGSTCQPLTVLERSLAELLGSGAPEGLVERLIGSGEVVQEGDWIYRRATAELEAELAARVHELLDAPPARKLAGLAEDEAAGEAGPPVGELTAEQQTGLQHAFAHRLSVITGGPGTGKTASIRTIARTAAQRGAKVMLVAPTGRAAIRMTEASGIRATTVHSALGWVPGEGPTRNAEDPLECDLLILDECSMANLELLVVLLRAVGAGTHVVLVGDADQLAPVGAGKPFAELVESDVVPSVRLTHIFRQAAGSMIVQGAHAIRRGEPPS
ncbi:MAG TPA: AAA family ATPase, partial [Solirubrobacteraceae bacterium]|nr:AAA family ATPase [Solirubrobacteraceae bacterium]